MARPLRDMHSNILRNVQFFFVTRGLSRANVGVYWGLSRVTQGVTWGQSGINLLICGSFRGVFRVFVRCTRSSIRVYVMGYMHVFGRSICIVGPSVFYRGSMGFLLRC